MTCKIAIIGAGSLGFTRLLISDIMSSSQWNGPDEIALMDIDETNLEKIYALVARDLKGNKRSGVTLSRTLNRKEALKDANYIINTVRIGGLEAFETDVEIPLKYGVDQCVGDTLGPGGIMYAQRGIPFILDLCRDIKDVSAPNALLLSYANPNAMLTWAALQYGGVETLGLCHGVQRGHHQLADALGIPHEELDYTCVGINHLTWYTRLERNGHFYSQEEIIKALESHPEYGHQEKVRIDMLKRFGYYSTESNGHLSEYLPWYRKRRDEIESWISRDWWVHGETGGYLKFCREMRDEFEREYDNWMSEPVPVYEESKRSVEHGAWIIEGRETGRIYRGHFNVKNGSAVANLPEDCVVEVPGYVDKSGVNIPIYGNLPDGPAAVCLSNISVQRLAVKAAVSGDATLLKQAMMLDPLTGAVCSPDEIWAMTDEMLKVQKKWLPQYQ